MDDEVKLETESCIIQADKCFLKGDWTIEFGDGWPLFPIVQGLTPLEQYDDRHWPRDGSGREIHHIPLTELVDGMHVMWKNNMFDYVWGEGVIEKSGERWYVSSSPSCWNGVGWSDKMKCWVTWGVIGIDPSKMPPLNIVPSEMPPSA